MRSRKTIKRIIVLLLLLTVLAAAAVGVLYSRNHSRKEQDAASKVMLQEIASAQELIADAALEKANDAAAASHVYSHRGNGERVEEHSFGGYDKAIADGSLCIEQDVVTSAEGTLYVSHDTSAWRMTGVGRDFAYMTDAEIDALTTYGGNLVLRLSDVFDRYGDTVTYVIEIKSMDSRAVESFASLVKEYGNEDRIIVQCFALDVLRQVEETFPDMPKMFLCKTWAEAAEGIAAPYVDIISIDKDMMSADLCRQVHESGKLFSVWTLETESDIRAAIGIGTDAYFTNDTPLAIALEKELRPVTRPKQNAPTSDAGSAVSADGNEDGSQDATSAEPTVLFFMSDYQNEEGFPDPKDTLTGVLEAGAQDGLTPDLAVMCGDFTNDSKLHDYQLSPEESIAEIRSVVGAECPDLTDDDMIFVQGNHDALTESISQTGLHEFDDFLIYVLNTENDFPWKQGKVSGCHAKIEKSSAALKECLDGLIASGETRPIFIAGHVPLHFSARTSSRHSTGDNLYSSLIFDVLNNAAKTLEIVFLFGHDHSKGWDCYLGGSSVYRAAGKTILIPEFTMDKTTSDTFREEPLYFTYMNAGYGGYYMNCSSVEVENGTAGQYTAADETLTGTYFEIYPDRVVVHRYSSEGEHPLGWDGEADPYKNYIDRGLIDPKYYSKRVESPQTIELGK